LGVNRGWRVHPVFSLIHCDHRGSLLDPFPVRPRARTHAPLQPSPSKSWGLFLWHSSPKAQSLPVRTKNRSSMRCRTATRFADTKPPLTQRMRAYSTQAHTAQLARSLSEQPARAVFLCSSCTTIAVARAQKTSNLHHNHVLPSVELPANVRGCLSPRCGLWDAFLLMTRGQVEMKSTCPRLTEADRSVTTVLLPEDY
jgi:hypothetical protein